MTVEAAGLNEADVKQCIYFAWPNVKEQCKCMFMLCVYVCGCEGGCVGGCVCVCGCE